MTKALRLYLRTIEGWSADTHSTNNDVPAESADKSEVNHNRSTLHEISEQQDRDSSDYIIQESGQHSGSIVDGEYATEEEKSSGRIVDEGKMMKQL